jgi:hypothetical protein
MEMQRQTIERRAFLLKTLSGADKSFPRQTPTFSNTLLEDADYA